MNLFIKIVLPLKIGLIEQCHSSINRAVCPCKEVAKGYHFSVWLYTPALKNKCSGLEEKVKNWVWRSFGYGGQVRGSGEEEAGWDLRECRRAVCLVQGEQGTDWTRGKAGHRSGQNAKWNWFLSFSQELQEALGSLKQCVLTGSGCCTKTSQTEQLTRDSNLFLTLLKAESTT